MTLGSNLDKKLVSDIVRWDVLNWSKALEFWEHKVNWNDVHSCLELGAHDGGLSLWLALKKKSVICSDLKDTRQCAEPHHKKYSIDGFIEYADIDATNIPFANHFDIIAFKSVLGGIGRDVNKDIQQTVIDQIHKALKPGGKLLFAENLVASGFHRFARKRFIRWGESWRYVSIEEMAEFLRNFSDREIRVTGVAGALGRTERQRNLLSVIDQVCLNRITPAKWKYLAYGIAQK